MPCMMTTTPGFDGYRITAYHGIVTAEVSMVSALKGQDQKWDAARAGVYEALTQKLPEGANAIVGVTVAHNYFQGAGMSAQFYFFATGTAVTIETI